MHNCNTEEHGPLEWIYVTNRTEIYCIPVLLMRNSVCSNNKLSTKLYILLCKKVSYNHRSVRHRLSDCIKVVRYPTWRRNSNPDGGQGTTVGIDPDTHSGRPAPQY